MRAQSVACPSAETSNHHYVSNRPPLLSNPLVKLPLGAVRPRGWLAHQLELMARGMTGRLEELSSFLRPDNGWLYPANDGWEEQAYWFRGFYSLAVLTGDPVLYERARHWIEAILNSQDADGYFGPQPRKRVLARNGRALIDLWPHMVMLDAVIQHREYTGDPRVLPFMRRFFAFCAAAPDDELLAPTGNDFGDWRLDVQHARAGDMIPHIHWLFNQIGEPWLLPLAARFYQRILPPHDEWLDRHIVNFTQRFSYSGLYYPQSQRAADLEAVEYWYRQHIATWGQQPRGIFAADEQIRPGKVDPRQGFETCGMVEFNKSFYLLGRITGQALYADRCEDITLNHFPVASLPDLKGLHYLTASNQPQLDASTEHDYFNKGRQINYSPHDYRCCQHNVAMGWPWYAQHLWQASGRRRPCRLVVRPLRGDGQGGRRRRRGDDPPRDRLPLLGRGAPERGLQAQSRVSSLPARARLGDCADAEHQRQAHRARRAAWTLSASQASLARRRLRGTAIRHGSGAAALAAQRLCQCRARPLDLLAAHPRRGSRLWWHRGVAGNGTAPRGTVELRPCARC